MINVIKKRNVTLAAGRNNIYEDKKEEIWLSRMTKAPTPTESWSANKMCLMKHLQAKIDKRTEIWLSCEFLAALSQPLM